MVDTQVTTMVLKVDLQCRRCFKKIKRILCKFPQIQDQVCDEGQNTVTIKVRCCDPEKIKNKILCKALDILKSIEIKVPETPKPPESTPLPALEPKPKPDPKTAEPAPPPPEPAPKPDPEPAQKSCCKDCLERCHGGLCHHGHSHGHCGGWNQWPCNPPPPCGGYYYGYGRPACEDVVVVRYDDNYGPPCAIM